MARLSHTHHSKCIDTSQQFAGGEAGQAFEKLAQVHLKQDSRLEAASSYVDAAKCYQKTSKTGLLLSPVEADQLCCWACSQCCSSVLYAWMHSLRAVQMYCGHSTTLCSTTPRLDVWAWQQSS